MNPSIIKDFNWLSAQMDTSGMYEIGTYNDVMMRADGRAVENAYVYADPETKTYKLRWRGGDRY